MQSDPKEERNMEPVIRNLRFDLDDRTRDVPKHWHGGRRSVSTFFDNLSIFFPAGERFFMASVHAQRHRVKDPTLQREVRAFCGQEGVHGREHRRYNEMIAAHGYPAAAMERRVEKLLALVTRVTPKRWQLAATCALEHFTALMGHFLLGDARMLDGAHPTMAALWRWHAAEENEHKSVAYDVFLAAGGTYPERVGVMVVASLIFWAKVLEQQVRMMKSDGTWLSADEWRALARFLFVEPGGMRPMLTHYFAYYRPGFHPRDIDCDDLLEAWKRELAEASPYESAA
jgi:predicted metal-dependent hydrolase